MGYKFLGFLVWQGGKLYLRRRYPLLTSRRVLAGAAVVAGVGVAVSRGALGDRTQG